MESKDRVYTLGNSRPIVGDIIGLNEPCLCLLRNKRLVLCKDHPKITCGDWCPAFQIRKSTTSDKYYVDLKCFPQEVSYQIIEKGEG
jgi:hypothetical protein